MKIHLLSYITFIALAFTACTSTDVVDKPTPQVDKPTPQYVAAEEFLNNIGAGQLFLAAIKKETTEAAKKHPQNATTIEDIFSSVTSDDFIELAADIYTRHLSEDALIELAQETQKPTIQKLFAIVFKGLLKEEEFDNKKILAQFDRSETLELIQFSKTDSFVSLKKVLPNINAELEQAGKKLGEKLLYLYFSQKA